MKLSITQIVLGVIIVLAACYIAGWMLHKAPSQLKQPINDENGTLTYVDIVPEDEILFNVSRYGSYLLPILGIFILIIGTAQASRGGAAFRYLSIISIVTGILTAALAYIIVMWGYPTTFRVIMPAESDLLGKIFTNPGRSFVGVESATAVMLALALAVVGVGIAQLIKWKKPLNI